MSAPERIYLQLPDDCDGYEDAVGEVTWCVDRINENDLEYVRASPDWLELHDLIIKGFVEEASQKARSLANR